MLLVKQARRVVAKLETYTKFTNVMVVAVAVAFPLVVPFMSSTLRKMTCTMIGDRLHGLSLSSGMPYLLFSILCVICALRAPSQFSTGVCYFKDSLLCSRASNGIRLCTIASNHCLDRDWL
ncbi:hypothetical protein MKX03_001084 [Papaver bracteatum]|nr:hypothetical protein MKX03_001084 [Papaver bracteatum]